MYLYALPGAKENDKISDTELNKTLLRSMKNVYSKQAYAQGFDCETITFKNLLICMNTWKVRKIL